MSHGGAGIVDHARACVAGRRDGRAKLVVLDEATGKARSSFLSSERARLARDVDAVVDRRLPDLEQAELDLRKLRGVYAGALGALPGEGAVRAAEQARCEALEALRAYREALDEIWLASETCARRYECVGQAYLRQARVSPSSLSLFEAPAQLNACESRYATFSRLVDDGYFDRHYPG